MSDIYGGDFGSAAGNVTTPASGAGASSLFPGGSASYLGPAAGAAGFGMLLAQGEGSLPWEYGQLTSQVPGLIGEAQQVEGQGGALVGQGKDALAMAEAGQLTDPQKAQLGQYETGLTNMARQQYASMGRNPDADTSFIQTTADIDAKVNAMAQQQIQSTIQLGLGEVSGGSSLIGQGLGFQNAANSALIAAGEAQVKLDTNYSDNLTKAFAAIGQMFGAGAKVAAV